MPRKREANIEQMKEAVLLECLKATKAALTEYLVHKPFGAVNVEEQIVDLQSAVTWSRLGGLRARLKERAKYGEAL